jgi:hypothetical protein
MHTWLAAAADPRIRASAPLIGVQSYGYAVRARSSARWVPPGGTLLHAAHAVKKMRECAMAQPSCGPACKRHGGLPLASIVAERGTAVGRQVDSGEWQGRVDSLHPVFQRAAVALGKPGAITRGHSTINIFSHPILIYNYGEYLF